MKEINLVIDMRIGEVKNNTGKTKLGLEVIVIDLMMIIERNGKKMTGEKTVGEVIKIKRGAGQLVVLVIKWRKREHHHRSMVVLSICHHSSLRLRNHLYHLVQGMTITLKLTEGEMGPGVGAWAGRGMIQEVDERPYLILKIPVSQLWSQKANLN